MDAINLLTQDHRTVENVFQQFEQTSGRDKRRELVDTMIEELSIHATIEEQHFYPFLRDLGLEQDSVEEAEHEHAKAKAVLAALTRLQPEDEHFEPMVRELIADVRQHVSEEENDLFPRLRDAASQDDLEQVGQRLEQAKQEAPTKPAAKDLHALSQDELYEYAQQLDVEGRSDMAKDDLISALAPA